jgi:hypothetical protein
MTSQEVLEESYSTQYREEAGPCCSEVQTAEAHTLARTRGAQVGAEPGTHPARGFLWSLSLAPHSPPFPWRSECCRRLCSTGRAVPSRGRRGQCGQAPAVRRRQPGAVDCRPGAVDALRPRCESWVTSPDDERPIPDVRSLALARARAESRLRCQGRISGSGERAAARAVHPAAGRTSCGRRYSARTGPQRAQRPGDGQSGGAGAHAHAPAPPLMLQPAGIVRTAGLTRKTGPRGARGRGPPRPAPRSLVLLVRRGSCGLAFLCVGTDAHLRPPGRALIVRRKCETGC